MNCFIRGARQGSKARDQGSRTTRVLCKKPHRRKWKEKVRREQGGKCVANRGKSADDRGETV